MKKYLCIFAMLLPLMLASCDQNEKNKDLNGTKWTVYAYEDYFRGAKVGDDVVSGTLEGKYVKQPYFVLNVPAWGMEDWMLYAGEYKIISKTDSRLVLEVFYQEYEGLKAEELEYDVTFKGTKIYYWGEGDSLVYFNLWGKAVDVAREKGADKEYYYYDCTRILCRAD